jgi:hypothetical protein
MSLLKSNSVQIGQSVTATNNFTLSVPSSPDGTIKLARGNSGATTQDILTVNSSGAVTLTNGGTITLGAVQNSTSGTAIDFTGIPSWVKKVTVMFDEVSTNGTNSILVQLGDSGGIEATGYVSTSVTVDSSGNSVGLDRTDGYVWQSSSASNLHSGNIYISNLSTNKWIASHSGKLSTTNLVAGGGSKTLSDTLDRIRITTVGGTDTFDAGSVNIMYEG